MTPPRFKATYGILDVEQGRKALAKHLRTHGPQEVVIYATITDPFGSDDGTSIEFNMNVSRVVPTPHTGADQC